MPLTAGTRIGPYEILEPIGAGGMGEVYRARDTKLGRDVAIKALPDAFASDGERIARFDREAKLLASLNHPNIASIYGFEGSPQPERSATRSGVAERDVVGVGPYDSERCALVLELVEGPTLAERIAQGPIPVDEAIAIARQIADALDAGHEAGVVHRDLKPANVKLKDDGTVKVLDYGLAKALEVDTPDGTESELSQSPTLARRTQVGVILGTAAYSSPEQARGKRVDKRTDIWAFGAVLFEMVTGKRLFQGEDLTETLASVVKDQPDFREVPPELRRLLDKCLQKNRKDRLRDIGDVWELLEGETAKAAAPESRTPWLVAAVGAIAAVAMTLLYFGRPGPPPAEVSRFRVATPAGAGSASTIFVALSPDGRHLALVSRNQVWVRSFDSLEATPLDGTEGALYPFWSPDGASLGFFADGQLKTIGRTGGLVQRLTAVAAPRGGSWSRNGTIVFSPDFGGRGLFAVDTSGGDVRAVTTLSATGGTDAHRYPQFLPDGERFLYLHLTRDADVNGVYVGSLDGTPPVRVLDGGDQARYAASTVDGETGFLVFRRRDVLMAQPFDSGSLRSVGAALPVVEGVDEGYNTGAAAFSISAGGTLAIPPYWNASLAWFDRSGERLDVVTGLSTIDSFSISPDQVYAAISEIEREPFSREIWLQNLSGGSPSRFTFGPRPGWMAPVWAPDASSVAYCTSDQAGLGTYEIRRKSRDMSGPEEALLSSDEFVSLWDWAPDGSYLVYELDGNIYTLPLHGDRTPVPYLETPAVEKFAQVSPDGRWMAYVSEEEVYVKSIPATESLWQISTGGGSMPRWRQDGRELFYVTPDGTLTAVEVGATVARQGPAVSFEFVATPRPLFGGLPISANWSQFIYQPSADGQRFAVFVPAPGVESSITVVLNWTSELERLVPTGN
jgi:Tol biopolymer transport system component